jgi:hypothetical protein
MEFPEGDDAALGALIGPGGIDGTKEPLAGAVVMDAADDWSKVGEAMILVSIDPTEGVSDTAPALFDTSELGTEASPVRFSELAFTGTSVVLCAKACEKGESANEKINPPINIFSTQFLKLLL